MEPVIENSFSAESPSTLSMMNICREAVCYTHMANPSLCPKAVCTEGEGLGHEHPCPPAFAHTYPLTIPHSFSSFLPASSPFPTTLQIIFSFCVHGLISYGTSLVVQWLDPHSQCRGLDWLPGQGTRSTCCKTLLTAK